MLLNKGETSRNTAAFNKKINLYKPFLEKQNTFKSEMPKRTDS